ncbi:MAG: Metal cation efflux system protein CzcD [candidate division WS2 bacterium]|nr:Metal cation efflux system protein CzcD [Candidatus Psychracetigena formicireducens]
MAALFNGLFLFGVTGYIFYEGVKRLLNPQPVLGLQMFLIALLGLVVNIISVFVLYGTQREDLNIKSAFLHMLADTVSSVVVVIGAVIIHFTSWFIVDPLVSIGLTVVIFCWARGLFRDSINVLLETAPKGINVDIVSKELKESIGEIKEISDIHIWEITSKMYSMTAHIKILNMSIDKNKEILDKINKYVDEKYDIEHTTIQFEPYK